MKRKGFNHKKLHLVLVGLILVGFVVFSFANIIIKMTGEPVRSVGEVESIVGIGEGETQITPEQKLEEPKFNGYIVELKDEPVSKYYLREKENKLLSETKVKENTNSYRKNLVDKQTLLENKI